MMPRYFDYIVDLRPLLLISPPIAFRPARCLFTRSPMAASNSGERVVKGRCHHPDAKDGPRRSERGTAAFRGYPIQGEAFDRP
jgi:hypothetical protein